MKQNEKGFIATGTFLVKKGLEPVLAHNGELIGFKTPQGTVRLCICLEVEQPDGTFKYLSKESDMEEVGIILLDYDELKFTDKE